MASTQMNNEDTGTILIIDDNPDNRLLLASQLGMKGYAILEAEDGRSGIEKAQAYLPDLVLLDVMMPVMNGFEVCTHLKTDPITSNIPIVMVTALRDIEYRIRGIDAGADEFLSRPHHREELLVRVRSLIRLKQARSRLEEERQNLRLLNNVARATTNAQLDLDQMMVEIITHTQTAVNAAKGSIMLVSPEGMLTHKIITRIGRTAEKGKDVPPVVLAKGLAGWLMHEKQGTIINDTTQDERWIILPDDTDVVGSAIGVPLVYDESILGVLILIHPEKEYFKHDQLDLLNTIAAQVSVTIRNASLFSQTNEQRQKLSTLLEKSSDAIITTTADMKIELVNQAAEALFGLSEREIAGRPLNSVPSLVQLAELVETETDPTFNQAVDHEIGTVQGRTLYATTSQIPDVGYMIVLQDITELKQFEEMRLENERAEQRRVKETFARYMSPRLVDQVLNDEPGLLATRQRRRAVVLFADLRGFTRMIINVEPDEAIAILNHFFTAMTEVVYEHNGTIFDLIGDELMVGFNVPMTQTSAEVRAVQAALAMQVRFEILRREWFSRTGVELGLGIGIDSGNVIMGNVGAETRMNFAMVGETVNTAHRLVDLAKDSHIVISEEMYREVNAYAGELVSHPTSFKSMGKIALKGKPDPELIYRMVLERSPLTA